MVGERLKIVAALMALVCVQASGALASGAGTPVPWYLDQYGGDPADVAAWFNGRVGVVTPTAPRPMLFVDWRLLHRRPVGPLAGDALSTPCCGPPWWTRDYSAGVSGWTKARSVFTDQPALSVDTERAGPDNTSVANCFPDAFDTATATLKDRAARYGAASLPVKAWLTAQDAVFQACHDPNATLPQATPGAPPWLSADRAYQAAALALYTGRNLDAAARFSAIARDGASPWRDSGLYLAARALIRQALAERTPAGYAGARQAVATLAAAAPAAIGRDRTQDLDNLLDFNERPQTFLATLQRELDAPGASPTMAVAFRDYTELGETAAAKPEALDWIDTMRARPAPSEAMTSDPQQNLVLDVTRYEAARKSALAHAVERWRAGQDPAWLIAALSLADADDAATPALLRAADEVRADQPAWVSAQHHSLRLTLANAPPAESRRRLDAILAHANLSVGDRNVFAAQRAQVASSLDEFARFALRRRLCAGAVNIDWRTSKPTACIRARWETDDVQRSGIYDGPKDTGSTGLGDDARAIIDRASLADRLALARERRLPAKLRLDIALTNYGRAVQLQDSAAIDACAQELATLLPLMGRRFQDVSAARPGPDKRFAEFLVLAMIPGLRTDLIDYERPEGRRVADFQRHWTDWVILRRADRRIRTLPPALVFYQADGTGFSNQVWGVWGAGWPDAMTDLTCLGECGRGAAPLRLPEVVRAHAAKAADERAWFFKTDHPYDKPSPPTPPGAVDAWDEMLAFAASHPADPRIPEALHWLVHVGHFGGSHNHSGHRAFTLLHARYPNSPWAKRTPYYND